MEPDDKITLDLGGNSITIDLTETYGATTTYLADSVYSITTGASDTIVISDGTNSSYTLASDWTNGVGIDTIDITSIFGETYNEQEIEKMCKEYPGLEKVWRNFKSVYDMVKQDYEGKKKAGELDDDIPF
jgi:hypothetical protein